MTKTPPVTRGAAGMIGALSSAPWPRLEAVGKLVGPVLGHLGGQTGLFAGPLPVLEVLGVVVPVGDLFGQPGFDLLFDRSIWARRWALTSFKWSGTTWAMA